MKTIPAVGAAASSAPNFSRLCASALIALFTLTLPTEASAAAPAGTPAFDKQAERAHRQQSENQTLALAGLMASYRHADEMDKANLLSELIDQAGVRQAFLADLAQTDPDGALRAVLPAKVRKGMPDEVRQMLEQKRDLEGELELFYEDYPDGSHKLGYVLNTDAGRVALQRVPQERGLNSGTRVRARGWMFGNTQTGDDAGTLVLNDEAQSLQLLADGTSDTQTVTSQSSLYNTLGEQRVLVMMVNFLDNADQPWTVEQARQTVFGEVNDFYKENSNNQTWLTGDVHGYYTLPINSTCDAWEIHVKAQEAAEAEGVDLSGYGRMVYVFPRNNTCGWSGKGTIGGNPSMAWANGSLSLRTVGHELGHNLGLHHAKLLDCGSDVIGDRCVSIEYGDSMDIMGESGVTGHFNAFNKELLGWLSPAMGEIAVAESDGTYQLEPYETASSGEAKGLKVRRGTDATTGLPLWYYLEYRQALGFDGYLEGKLVTEGVVFHLATEADADSSQLIDMTPESAWHDEDDASLVSGASYSDPDGGVTITTEWADASGASVSVSYSGQSCVRAQPGLLVTPGESAWVEAGTTVTYSATLTNRDSSACAASDFEVTAAAPAGWVAVGDSLNLAPGASGSVTVSITSADGTGDGFYDIAIDALNSAEANHKASALVTYVVDTPMPACVAASPQLSLAALEGEAVLPGTPVTYLATVTNRDSDSCEASTFDVAAEVPSGWSASGDAVSLAPGASASVNVTVASSLDAAEGLYPVEVKAFNHNDAGYSAGVAVSYSVAAPVEVCEAAAPLLTLSVSDSGEVAAGTTVTYSGTVTNRDSSGCETSEFALFADTPAGWSAGDSSVSLAPGASATFNLSITSGADAVQGSYYIGINAQSVADSSLLGSDVASYRVAAPQNSAPVAVADSVVLPSKSAVIINVLANDSDADGDGLTVIGVTQGAKGSVQILADGSLRYTPAKNFKGSDSFSYTVSDGISTDSATVSVSLADSGGGKGNGKK